MKVFKNLHGIQKIYHGAFYKCLKIWLEFYYKDVIVGVSCFVPFLVNNILMSSFLKVWQWWKTFCNNKGKKWFFLSTVYTYSQTSLCWSRRDILQWNWSKLNLFETNFCILIRQVFGLYMLNEQDSLRWEYLYFGLYRILLRQVSLYFSLNWWSIQTVRANLYNNNNEQIIFLLRIIKENFLRII